MSEGKAFFDTNVLLYMYSSADSGKQARARELYRKCALSNSILLSTQVVQEFFVAGLRKLLLAREHVREVATALLDSPLVIVGPNHMRTAIEYEGRYNLSCWDALIVAAAESGGTEILYTEDLSDGERYGTVMVRNPFRS